MGILIDASHLFAGSDKMSKKQAALYMGYTTRWVELRMSNDEMPYTRDTNGRVWFSRRALDDWISEFGMNRGA